jgi:hypothetical protein
VDLYTWERILVRSSGGRLSMLVDILGEGNGEVAALERYTGRLCYL